MTKDRRIYSDQDLLENLRRVSRKAKGSLTVSRFVELGGEPTVAVFIARFGSWANACKKAKVNAGKGRTHYARKHSDEDLLSFVKRYLISEGTSGSALGYDEWQKTILDAPSLALIRQRLGKWNEIKTAAQKRN